MIGQVMQRLQSRPAPNLAPQMKRASTPASRNETGPSVENCFAPVGPVVDSRRELPHWVTMRPSPEAAATTASNRVSDHNPRSKR